MNRIILAFGVLLSLLILFSSIEHSIESMARKQNSFNLNAVKQCLPKTSITEDELLEALPHCIDYVRSLGSTGDIFVLRKSDKKLVYDVSNDAGDHTNDIFLTKETGCKMFSNPASCSKGIEVMFGSVNNNVYWEFDNSMEWINYVKVNNVVNDTYVINQGTQRDEVSEDFLLLKSLLIGLSLLMISLSVL